MTPEITVTEVAQDKFSAALADEPADAGIRLAVQKLDQITLRYELEIVSPDDLQEDDVEVLAGKVKFWIGPRSALLIDGATIDYLQTGASEGFKFINPNDLRYKRWDAPIAARFQKLLEDEINPGIASHGGVIILVDYTDGVARVHMGGGCQGCGQAGATLQEGVEARVKEVIPEIREVIDATDHGLGENPYY
ncbi:MAG: iron-sulfur cluster assembly accessory protein [Myxococcales bacterium]|nr:iron-sulfur cluster assembly accessory protein [Myxococcales bacterium]